MSDYIKREDAIDLFKSGVNSFVGFCTVEQAIENIKAVPKADVVPVETAVQVQEPKTQYDRIRNMSVEGMAEFLYSAPDKVCFDNCKRDTGNKYSCKFGEGVPTEKCIRCMKEYLESEVTE